MTDSMQSVIKIVHKSQIERLKQILKAPTDGKIEAFNELIFIVQLTSLQNTYKT